MLEESTTMWVLRLGVFWFVFWFWVSSLRTGHFPPCLSGMLDRKTDSRRDRQSTATAAADDPDETRSHNNNPVAPVGFVFFFLSFKVDWPIPPELHILAVSQAADQTANRLIKPPFGGGGHH